jgi:hypothetical protein
MLQIVFYRFFSLSCLLEDKGNRICLPEDRAWGHLKDKEAGDLRHTESNWRGILVVCN